jgi:hypothetical protein
MILITNSQYKLEFNGTIMQVEVPEATNAWETLRETSIRYPNCMMVFCVFACMDFVCVCIIDSYDNACMVSNMHAIWYQNL